MNKILFSLLLLIATLPVQAQPTTQATLTRLLKHAASNFAEITGSLDYESEGLQVFNTKLKLNIGSECIARRKDSTYAYLLSCVYPDAKQLEKTVEAFIKTHFPVKDFRIMDYGETEDDLEYETSIYSRKTNRQVLFVSVQYDQKEKAFYYTLMLYGK